MTATIGAGFQPVVSIRPERPHPSLLTVAKDMTATWAGLLPAGHIGDPRFDRPRPKWATGISWRAATCVPGYRWPFCPSDPSDKNEPAAIEDPGFYPFGIYVPYRCDWVLERVLGETPNLGPDTPTRPDYERDASDQLDAVTPWHIANELWTGSISGNPSLQSEATDESAASAVHPVTGLGALLDAFQGAGTGAGPGQGSGVPIVHTPSSIVTSLMANRVANQQGDIVYGPCGSLISAGPGYPIDPLGAYGPKTIGAPNGEIAGAGNEWMFISGAVEYALGERDVMPTDEQDQLDRRSNTFEVWAERQAIVRFDPLCVFACRVYIPSPANGETV